MIDAFIDTNVLLYAASEDPAEEPKATVARTLLETLDFGVSVQVLQEFYVNATGKLVKTIPEQKLQKVLRLLREQPVLPVTRELFESAVEVKNRHQISYWDAAIIAAAKELGATIIYSEDLTHGHSYEGIKVNNPFLAQ